MNDRQRFLNRECVYCGCKLPDNTRGVFCDEDCEIKYERQSAGYDMDYYRSYVPGNEYWRHYSKL